MIPQSAALAGSNLRRFRLSSQIKAIGVKVIKSLAEKKSDKFARTYIRCVFVT